MRRLVVIVLVLLLMPVVSAQRFNIPEIKVTLVSQEPSPVEPGEVVTIKFKVENFGAGTRDEVFAELMLSKPLSLYSEKKKINLGTLRGDQNGVDSVLVEFDVKVDEKAVENDEFFDLKISYGTNSFLFKDFVLSVVTRDAIVAVTDVFFDRPNVQPGDVFTLGVELTNFADTNTKSLKLALDLTGLPIGSVESKEQRLIQLSPQESDSLLYKLRVDSDAVPGLYKVPTVLTYKNNLGNEFNIINEISILVFAVPEVLVYAREPAVLARNKLNSVTLEVVNKGLGKIKFLDIAVKENEDFKLLSSSYSYLGDIDSDDTDSIEVKIFPSSKQVVVPVLLTYTDSDNKKRRQSVDLVFPTFTSNEFVKYGLQERGVALPLLLFIAFVVCLGYWWYRKRRKK